MRGASAHRHAVKHAMLDTPIHRALRVFPLPTSALRPTQYKSGGDAPATVAQAPAAKPGVSAFKKRGPRVAKATSREKPRAGGVRPPREHVLLILDKGVCALKTHGGPCACLAARPKEKAPLRSHRTTRRHPLRFAWPSL